MIGDPVQAMKEQLHDPQPMWVGQNAETLSSLPQDFQISQSLCHAHRFLSLIVKNIGRFRTVNYCFARKLGLINRAIVVDNEAPSHGITPKHRSF